MTTKEWDRGESVRIHNTYKDTSGTEVDPDSIELKIYSPSGVLDTTVNYPGDIVRTTTGVYRYDYDIAADAVIGWWVNKWTAVFGTQEDVTPGQFFVRDPEKKLYCTVDQVYEWSGQDSTFVAEDTVKGYIVRCMDSIDTVFGKSFQYGTSETEWFDTDQPDKNIKRTTLFLRYRPILSITSVKEYNTSNELSDTHTADDYWIDLKTGRLQLTQGEFTQQRHRVEVKYVYGYETVPGNIMNLCAVLAAMKMHLHFIGQSVDDVTSYSAAGLSISVGEPYTASARAVEFLTKERDKLIATIGRLKQSVFIV